MRAKLKLVFHYSRIISVVIPTLFFVLGWKYHDFFYFLLGAISSTFSFLFIKTQMLSHELQLPSVRHHLERVRVHLKSRLKAKKTEKDQIIENQKKTDRALIHYYLTPILALLISAFGIFFYLSLTRLSPHYSSSNIIFDYYASFLSPQNGFQLPILGLLALATITLTTFLIKKSQIKHKAISIGTSAATALISSLVVMFLSLALSLGATYLYAFAEGSISVSKANLNPQSAGIIFGATNVLSHLHELENTPKILTNKESFKKLIISALLTGSGKGNFYTQRILKSLPTKLLPAVNLPKKSLVMFGNSLLIIELNKDEIESISPILGKSFVRHYFDPRYIKDEPEIQVMSRQEYLKFREDQINIALAKLDNAILETQNSINTIYSNISIDKQKIAANQSGLEQAQTGRETAWSYCKTAGFASYYFNTFYRYYTDSECESQRRQWDETVAGFQKNISDWQAALGRDQYQLSEFQKFKESLSSYRVLIEAQKDTTPNELGIFQPQKSVKVVFESVNPQSVADYLTTLVHEYLHYTSYVSKNRSLIPFFEEGLTEYFSRRIIEQDLEVKTNLGYPLLVKIIKEIANKIPEKDLEEIYFTKDEKRLYTLLNGVYGKNFIKDSQYYFEVLPYAPGKEALKIANNMLFKMEAKELKEEDLYSSLSELK